MARAANKETVEKEEVASECVETVENKDLEASNIIKDHMLASVAFGAVPVPMVDLVGLTGVQLNMLRKLSALYGQKFSEELAKKSIISLVGSGVALPVAVGLSSLIKSIPVVGQGAGMVALGSTGAATTYAIGRVFVKHFNSGGDFLSFSSKKAKEEFAEELKDGKEAAKNMEPQKATA